MTTERKHYIDNLRWMAILLLFPFHAAQIWSGGTYSGFYIWSHTNNILYAFSYSVYPWYMTFLFALAGISCKYSLQKRTNKQFITERIKKLLIPFVFGVLTLAPIMTYIAEIYHNGYTGSYLSQYILFFTKPTDLTGYKGGFTPGHLWFLLYLFIISLVALLVILLQKKFMPKLRLSNIPYPVLILLFIPDWLFNYIGNFGGKSLGQFFILYIIGFYILSEDNILAKLKKYRFISLAIFVISGGIFTYLFCFSNYQGFFLNLLYIFFGWIGIITWLGIGQSIFDFNNKLSSYLTRASFPIYILHQAILVVTGFFVLKLSIGVAGQFTLIVFISLSATLIVYEIVKRIPVLRFLLGISKR